MNTPSNNDHEHRAGGGSGAAPCSAEIPGASVIEKLTPVQYAIVEQIIETIDILGGKSDCTTPLCSWGDTLSEKDVLQMLTQWNERNRQN